MTYNLTWPKNAAANEQKRAATEQNREQNQQLGRFTSHTKNYWAKTLDSIQKKYLDTLKKYLGNIFCPHKKRV